MNRSPDALADRPVLLLTLLLAAVYYLLGRLSLLLAIPPGFASSVWPAAGVALMALLVAGRRLWPGVLLGSFLVNLSTTLQEPSGVDLAHAALVPAAIGIGASLQAVLGAWAIERWVGFPANLSQGRDIVRFLALGGPMSCVVSASVGVTTLLGSGVISPAEVTSHWWTWWIGDSIGVVSVVPLALALIGGPAGVEGGRRRRVAVPLIVGGIAVVLLFTYARYQEHRQLELEVGQRALSLAHAFEKHIDRSIDDLRSIEGLFAGTETVSRQDFRRFAQRILERNATIQALSWNPRVTRAERPAYEAAARADGFPGYRFTEATGAGLVAAGDRPTYVVVHYIEPYAGNEPALGYDIASNPDRLSAIERARDSGEPATTPGIRLVQETHEQTGVLILMPVYADGGRPASVEARRRALRGYATGVLRVGDALQSAFNGLPRQGFIISLTDRSDSPREVLLASLAGDPRPYGNARFAWAFDREVGGRAWSLRLSSTPGLLAGHPRWYAWMVLAGGLALVGLLGILLLVQTGRASELAGLNAQLAEGIEWRRRLEARQRRLIGELERRNAELERFSYTVSHDLKSPLITIKGFLGLLEKDLAAGRRAEVEVEISQLHKTADRMHELVSDLLEMSRSGQAAGPAEDLSLEEAASEVVAHLEAAGTASGVRFDVAPDLPRVRANRGQLLEVFQNLLDNAVKFMGDQEAPRVEIGARAEGDRVVCHVRDNGIGLDPMHHERVFGLFTRLDQSSEGTGVGLAVVRRIVETSGGSIWVESDGPGRGCTFYFTLPAA